MPQPNKEKFECVLRFRADNDLKRKLAKQAKAEHTTPSQLLRKIAYMAMAGEKAA